MGFISNFLLICFLIFSVTGQFINSTWNLQAGEECQINSACEIPDIPYEDIIVCGYTQSTSKSFVHARFDSNVQLLWVNVESHGADEDEECTRVVSTYNTGVGNGWYYAVTVITSSTTSAVSAKVYKKTWAGASVWDRVFSSTPGGTHVLKDIILDMSENAIMGGYTNEDGNVLTNIQDRFDESMDC